MGSSTPVPVTPPSRSPQSRKAGGPNTAALSTVANGALTGVGSVYLTTHSVLVTVVAAASAVILAGLALLVR